MCDGISFGGDCLSARKYRAIDLYVVVAASTKLKPVALTNVSATGFFCYLSKAAIQVIQSGGV